MAERGVRVNTRKPKDDYLRAVWDICWGRRFDGKFFRRREFWIRNGEAEEFRWWIYLKGL